MLTLPLLIASTSGYLSTLSFPTQRICRHICVSYNFQFISFAEKLHPSDLKVHEIELIGCMVNARNSTGTSMEFPAFMCTLLWSHLFTYYQYLHYKCQQWFLVCDGSHTKLSTEAQNKKKINNIREKNIMEDFILVFRKINENYLLVDLDLHLNSQDPTRICSCLTVRSLQRCSSHQRKKNLLFSESYFLCIFHFTLLFVILSWNWLMYINY